MVVYDLTNDRIPDVITSSGDLLRGVGDGAFAETIPIFPSINIE